MFLPAASEWAVRLGCVILCRIHDHANGLHSGLAALTVACRRIAAAARYVLWRHACMPHAEMNVFAPTSHHMYSTHARVTVYQ